MTDNSIPTPGKHLFVRGDEYLLLPASAKPWVVKGLIPSEGAVNIYGKPKAGKSYAALGLALAVANESVTEWLGFPVEQHGKVAYFQIDTPRNSWQERLRRVVEKDPSIDLKNLYIADKRLIPTPFNITNPAHREWLAEAIRAINPVLVVIDVIREVHSFDENDATPMQRVCSQLLGATEGFATILISHSRKDQPLQGEDLMSDNRGSNYMAGRMDVVMKLTQRELHLQGRDTEYTKLPVKQRKTDGMLVLNMSEDKKVQTLQMIEMLKGTKGMTIHARAKVLASAWGCPFEAARSRIRDFLKLHPEDEEGGEKHGKVQQVQDIVAAAEEEVAVAS